ncbi:unnamed protein product, partial [Symbiodinium sp. KB8]
DAHSFLQLIAAFALETAEDVREEGDSSTILPIGASPISITLALAGLPAVWLVYVLFEKEQMIVGLEVIYATMSVMRSSRSSAYVIREAILKFYDDKKLWPRGLTSAMECIQVLDRLPSIVEPAPIPLISEQYVKALRGAKAKVADANDDGDDAADDAEASDAAEHSSSDRDHEDEKKPKTSSPKSAGFRFNPVFLKKAAASKKPKAKAKSKNCKPSAVPLDCGDYRPHEFNKQAKLFRANAKAAGHSPATARKMWIDSKERARLLSDVPLQELKRRKFVPKECTENPFPRAVHLRGASVDIVYEPVTMDLLTLRWVIEQPDGSFLPEMPRFQTLFRTFEDLIDTITERAGFMSREEMRRYTQKTVVRYTDSNGVKRHTGKPKELQKSQEYTKAFADFLAKYFVTVMKAEMPTILGYLNAKHVQPPGQWETWLG